MAILSKEGTRLVRLMDAEKLWIEPWGKNALRVRATCQRRCPGGLGAHGAPRDRGPGDHHQRPDRLHPQRQPDREDRRGRLSGV